MVFSPFPQCVGVPVSCFPSAKLVHESHSSVSDRHVLLTVAHGWWHIGARRVARELNLPLVCLFHDWWPDFPEIPVAFRPRIERQFHRTYMESDVAICVSEQMRAELGERTNSFVIHPVPSFTTAQPWTSDFELPLRLVYFGNLREYGPLIENALRALDGSDRVRLEVFGPNPLWTPGTEDYFRSRNLYHGFPPSDQFVKALQHFQAALVVMSFAPALRRRMTTSFSSNSLMQCSLDCQLSYGDRNMLGGAMGAPGRPNVVCDRPKSFSISPSSGGTCCFACRTKAPCQISARCRGR